MIDIIFDFSERLVDQNIVHAHCDMAPVNRSTADTISESAPSGRGGFDIHESAQIVRFEKKVSEDV